MPRISKDELTIPPIPSQAIEDPHYGWQIPGSEVVDHNAHAESDNLEEFIQYAPSTQSSV